MNSILKITRTAGNQLQKIAKDNNVNSILFSVKGGGCNGFNYKLEPFAEKPHKQDEIVPYKNINIIVCRSSIFHLLGTKVDWRKDIMGETFHFENPNAASSCGCGTSFSI